MKAQFTRTPGSVFLTPDPVQIPNATHIGARFQEWVNVANEMVAEVEPAPAPSQNPRPSVKPLGDPNEVRVSYIERYTLKKVNIYTGDPFPELQARCQVYADNHDVIVHLHTARNFEVFKPKTKPTNLQALLARVDAILQGGAK